MAIGSPDKIELSAIEAALVLHALRHYIETKGADCYISTQYLEDKLQKFIENRNRQSVSFSGTGATDERLGAAVASNATAYGA